MIVQVGNSRLGWRSPESLTTIGSMDSGLAPKGAPRNIVCDCEGAGRAYILGDPDPVADGGCHSVALDQICTT